MFGFVQRFGTRFQNVPPRLPSGLPANFSGIPANGDKMAEYLDARGARTSFNPIGSGIGSLRLDILSKVFKRGLWGFLGFSCYEGTSKPNKFTLWGAANFQGEYPPELVASRRKKL